MKNKSIKLIEMNEAEVPAKRNGANVRRSYYKKFEESKDEELNQNK